MTYREILRHFGSQAEIARQAGVTVAAVKRWQQQGIPLPRQYQLQVLTDGKLKAR